jgi:hypothetical protein
VILLLCGAIAISAQPGILPGADRYVKKTDTAAGTCNASKKGYVYFSTTTNTVKSCDGTSWSSGGGITTGTTASNGTANTLLKTNGSSQVADAPGVTQPAATTLKATVQTNTDIGLNITGAASQSGDLTQWNSSTPTTLAKMTSGGQLAFPGVAASTFQLDLTRTSTGGDQKGLQIQCGTGSNLASNQCFLLTDGSGHTFQRSYNGTGYVEDINSNTYTMQTSGGVGEGSIRLNPGSQDRQILAKEKTLVNNTVTSIADIALPTLTGTGGVIKGTTFVSNGTDVQSRSFIWRYSAVNKGGVYTTEIVVVSEAISTSSGTLAGTWTIVTGSNKITLKFNSNSSLTPTTQWVQYTLESFSEQAITIL